MNLYLIRHGRQSNPRCNVNVDLAAEGIEQVTLLAERFKDVTLDALYSSDLIRAIQTAEILNRYHNLDLEIRENIKEIDFGDWTGKEDTYINEHYQEFIRENKKLEEDLPYPGGECGEDVVKRAMLIIEEVLQSDKENVLIVTHGGVIRALTSYLLGLKQAQKGLFGVSLEHTGITQFMYNKENQKFYLQRFNDASHLEGHSELLRSQWKK